MVADDRRRNGETGHSRKRSNDNPTDSVSLSSAMEPDTSQRRDPALTRTGTARTEQSMDLRGAPTIEDMHADPGEGRVGRGKHGTQIDDTSVVGLFKSQAQAGRAVHALRDSGISEQKISIIAQDKHGGDAGRGAEIGQGRDDTLSLMFDAPIVTAGSGLERENYGAGYWTPAAVGGVAGMLTSSGLLVVPGIGQIFAAGPLQGVMTGGVTGSIANGLLDLGIPDARSRYIESRVKEGHILAVVHTDDPHVADRATAVMRQNGAEDVEIHDRKGAQPKH